MKVKNGDRKNIAVETEKPNKTDKPLSPDLLRKMNAYWRAANYLSVGQIYLYDNPLLKRPLTLTDVKHMLLGHWGTTPGQIDLSRPRWPMIVLRSPKGWTGPKVVDGLQIEGTFRAHQVPIAVDADHPEHLKLLEDWLKSYRPEELFDAQGRLNPELAELAPRGERRMGANPQANGGMLLRDLRMPDFRDYAESVPTPGIHGIGDTHVLGPFLRDVAKLNSEQRNFRVFGPDETLSNGLEALFDVTQRQWDAATAPSSRLRPRSSTTMKRPASTPPTRG